METAEVDWEFDYDATSQPESAPIYDLGEGIVPLGHDHGTFYYLSRAAQQVFALTADRHTKNNMLALASLPHYWEHTQFVGDKGNIKWDEAIDSLMRSCRKVGVYDPDRIRGRGAWLDQGTPLLHLGNRIIMKTEEVGLTIPGSKFVYESAKPLSVISAPPLSNRQANHLVKLSSLLRWERPVYAKLFAGWIALAPICGALSWRPSVWITGGPGSGKSWLRENIMARCLGDIALSVQSKTTEAGIRASLGSDARPVLFDEAEREDPQSAMRMQMVLDLVRQSSSEGGAEIIKGTGNQSGAKRYRIRSMWAFQSINVGILHQADESRISVLTLREPGVANLADQDRFRDLSASAAEWFTEEYSAGLIARSVSLISVIRANAETFARAIAAGHGTRRLGDQIGTLLAGAYSLHSTSLITPEMAAQWVAEQDWADPASSEGEKDEERLLRTIMAHRIRVGAVEMPISRLLEAAQGDFPTDGLPEAALALRTLSELGIKFSHRENLPGVYVSTNHPALRHALRGTPWDAGWSRALSRIAGTEPSGHAVRFSVAMVSKATWVPMSLLDNKGQYE